MCRFPYYRGSTESFSTSFLQKEHNPPYFHGEDVAAITIADGKVLEGDLPAKALEMVREWLSEHREELLTIWETQEFHQIPPLV